MVINNETQLIRLIKESSEEDAVKILMSYGNQRAANAIEEAWKRFRSVMKFWRKKDALNLKDYLLMHDENNNSYVSIYGLTKYLYKIDNVMKRINLNCSQETSDALAEIEDVMEQSIGDLKIDFRLAYSNSD